ncbi:MAG: hypothetical protein M1825_003798 [Sarcosagium campestre]|nr:MAG: hypothetical protein M1825_003798 [Sarcosagium campestre]
MESNLRRKDTTKGPPLRVLSLDGGGVRGYSMLILLQELMYRTFVEIEGKAPRRDQIPKPCDHFDLIAGTGTGGLIALMLGRMRLDLETCKDVYVRMTRRVFETDKTIAGIPYRSTLFKASKLEEAIRECVAEHTVYESEGNDGIELNGPAPPMSPLTSPSMASGISSLPQRRLSKMSTTSGLNTRTSSDYRRNTEALRWGDPNAFLYDRRENRTKTAVTAVYKGTPKSGSSVFLRSYDSRKEPPPEFNCTIWQAGRATSATGLAFKPIQIGQSVFIDEGAGKYNPSPQVLDEAAVNEWPGREVAVFVSIGTGKRPGGTASQQHLWWEDFVSSGVGDFAEARRRLISKIEGCEDTHQYMKKEHLAKRGVNPENYYRLNVEVGVGEFGMNEWNRLADISTSTRRYLAKGDVQWINVEAAGKLARVHKARLRQKAFNSTQITGGIPENTPAYDDISTPSDPMAVELPGAEVPAFSVDRPSTGQSYPPPPRYPQAASSQDKFSVVSSDEFPQPADTASPPRRSGELYPNRRSNDYHSPPRSSASSFVPSPRRSGEGRDQGPPGPQIPPPLPPKAPLSNPAQPPYSQRPPGGPPAGYRRNPLPYPDDDGPLPTVNMARKPELGR